MWNKQNNNFYGKENAECMVKDMSDNICIFKRIEKKYLLSTEQKKKLLELTNIHLIPDKHGKNTICSLYLDTPNYLLIRNSIDAKAYKEKLRLRSYGTPDLNTIVFLELKKKYKGVVYKRRVEMSLEEAKLYMDIGIKPFESQIMSEIDYAMEFYKHPKPAMFIAYDREAYYDKELPNLRLTFDSTIRYRKDDLMLEKGAEGKLILPEDKYILEIKTDGSMPVWLSNALDECGIRPASFSKYGTAYRDSMEEKNYIYNEKGDLKYVSNF